MGEGRSQERGEESGRRGGGGVRRLGEESGEERRSQEVRGGGSHLEGLCSRARVGICTSEQVKWLRR